MEKSYGFIYIWFDKKKKRYYIGSHWGTPDDGYICSSQWMMQAYTRRPETFIRRILKTVFSQDKLLPEENRWLQFIKKEELGKKYYNLRNYCTGPFQNPEKRDSIRKKISDNKRKKFQEKREAGLPLYDETALENIRTGTKLAAKPHTQEWKDENSKRMKKQWEDGTRDKAALAKHMAENNPLFNEETRKKVAIANSKPLPADHKAKAIGESRTESQKAASDKCSGDLKSRWADPVWKAKQIERLKEGAKNRPPRSEASKEKARLAQLGKPKPRNQPLTSR